MRIYDCSRNLERSTVCAFLFPRTRAIRFLSGICGRCVGFGFASDNAVRDKLCLGIGREFARAADADQDSAVVDPVTQFVELALIEGLFVSRSLAIRENEHINLVICVPGETGQRHRDDFDGALLLQNVSHQTVAGLSDRIVRENRDFWRLQREDGFGANATIAVRWKGGSDRLHRHFIFARKLGQRFTQIGWIAFVP